MDIVKSTKCKNYLTSKKQAIIKNIIKEYRMVANFIYKDYENKELPKTYKLLNTKEYRQYIKDNTDTFFSIRMLSEILMFTYGQLKSYHTHLNNCHTEIADIENKIKDIHSIKRIEQTKKQHKDLIYFQKRLKKIKKPSKLYIEGIIFN